MLPRRHGGRAAAACLLLVVVVGLLSCTDARPAPAASSHGGAAAGHSFKKLLDARRGSRVTELAELKRYLARFGYMPAAAAAAAGGHGRGQNPSDSFDEHLEVAVKRYQHRLSLPVTGRLDSATLDQMMSPRCGVADVVDDGGGHVAVSGPGNDGTVSRFTFFNGEPRWTRWLSPIVLTYALSPTDTIDYLKPEDVRGVFHRAFARWAEVIPVSFVETNDYDHADIKVGFYAGDHGDGAPFDGPLGELAHAFSPNDGHLHLDASEQWALNFDKHTSDSAFDLESVATHEIGHILGLGHSASRGAVMYPTIGTLKKKVDLAADDIQGVQQLYGANPNFRFSSSSSLVASWGRVVLSMLFVILVTHS